MTEAERPVALAQIADEVRVCTRCRLHEQRQWAVPGEGNPATEVVFVGEAPGFNEDREGRPFVGRAGGLLVKLLASIGWQRDDVFITNVVKCRPPENRDPAPDEIAACAPFLRRQLAALDPALVVTLGRYSMGAFMPGARISQAHGTMAPVKPESGAADALAFAMYHPAAALRATEIERTSFADMSAIPAALITSRERRARHEAERMAGPPVAAHASGDAIPAVVSAPTPTSAPAVVSARAPTPASAPTPAPAPVSAQAPTMNYPLAAPASPDPDPSADQLTLF